MRLEARLPLERGTPKVAGDNGWPQGSIDALEQLEC